MMLNMAWYTVSGNTVTPILNTNSTKYTTSNLSSNTTYMASVTSPFANSNTLFSAPDNVIVYPQFSTPTITPANPTITKGKSIMLNAVEARGKSFSIRQIGVW